MANESTPPALGRSFGRGEPPTTPTDDSGKRSKSESFYIHYPGTCSQCSHFLAPSDCELVDAQSEGFDSGTIDPAGYCSLFESGQSSPLEPTSPKEKMTADKGLSLIEPKSKGGPRWQSFSEPEEEEEEEKYGVAA